MTRESFINYANKVDFLKLYFSLMMCVTFTTDKVDYNSFRVKEAATVYSRELTAAIAAETALTELQQQGNDVLMVPFITKCQVISDFYH